MSLAANPEELTPAEAQERWLAKQSDKTERTRRSYRSRSDQFVEWCEENGITAVGELTPFVIDQYDHHVREVHEAPTTIKGHLQTTRLLLDYLGTIEAVPQTLSDALDVPVLSPQEASSGKRLEPAEAERLLTHYRNDTATFGTAKHAFLELAWFTGARLGALRGLDLGDYDPDEQRVRFRHRPETETPLKNKYEAERFVGISDHVVDALETYIARERSDKRDDHGRQPLFCARQGRPSWTTVRAWSYLSTEPCVYGDCPHGKEIATCSYRERNHASKCPSSRSPHHIRRGSVTWQLNQGLSIETVAKRVNASPRVIRQHYDAAGDAEEFEERRKAASAVLGIGEEEESAEQQTDDSTTGANDE